MGGEAAQDRQHSWRRFVHSRLEPTTLFSAGELAEERTDYEHMKHTANQTSRGMAAARLQPRPAAFL